MTNVNVSLNFESYIAQNDKWLSDDPDRVGDGIVDDGEFLAFLDHTHLQHDANDTFDNWASQSDFDKWYTANEAAITAFLASEEGGSGVYTYETGKDAMQAAFVEMFDARMGTQEGDVTGEKLDGQFNINGLRQEYEFTDDGKKVTRYFDDQGFDKHDTVLHPDGTREEVDFNPDGSSMAYIYGPDAQIPSTIIITDAEGNVIEFAPKEK